MTKLDAVVATSDLISRDNSAQGLFSSLFKENLLSALYASVQLIYQHASSSYVKIFTAYFIENIVVMYNKHTSHVVCGIVNCWVGEELLCE